MKINKEFLEIKKTWEDLDRGSKTNSVLVVSFSIISLSSILDQIIKLPELMKHLVLLYKFITDPILIFLQWLGVKRFVERSF